MSKSYGNSIALFAPVPAEIERRLQEGAARARAMATPFLTELRSAVGLRRRS